jgi:hypothetical protein
VKLSLRFQIPESLAEECEAVEEVRPPHSVVGISEFQWCRDEIPSLTHRWSREIDDCECAT